MEAGNEFEAGEVRELARTWGDQLLTQGVSPAGATPKVETLPFTTFASELRAGRSLQYAAQIEIALSPEEEATFLERFGLDPDRFSLGPARPDLVRVLRDDDGAYRLQIWDFKASQSARHEHFVQVAYYSFLLETAVASASLDNVRVDTLYGVIHSREPEPTEFELAPYRRAVEDFLRNRAADLCQVPAADAHFHLEEGCGLCEYATHCRAESDAGHDLSRIPYMSSESKRRLRAHGIMNHRLLAQVALPEQRDLLRSLSHDLRTNLDRYIELAGSLDDGLPRVLATTTLMMPRYEDIRIAITAEQDPVTGTCFALGLKTLEGFDADTNRPIGIERVFLSRAPDGEGEMLLEFLRTLNDLLRRTDAVNRVFDETPVDEQPSVVEAGEKVIEAEKELQAFKKNVPRITKTNPRQAELLAERAELQQRVKETELALKEAGRTARWELRRSQKKLHFYIYDRLDLSVLRSLVERHLFDEDLPELLAEIRTLVRLFPPTSILPDVDTFRTVPGTVVIDLLRTMVALPVPYLYDLRSVSRLYRPHNKEGVETGSTFGYRFGFGWEGSNQIPFERIHDVWEGKSFAYDPRDKTLVFSPEEIANEIKRTVIGKLAATDSVVRRVKEDIAEGLRLRKEGFRLHETFDPLDIKTLEALRVFTMLEASLQELDVKSLHTLPSEDRAAKFRSLRDLRFLSEEVDDDNQGKTTLWFSFDPDCRDVRFGVGNYNLVLTNECAPEMLLGDIDGNLYVKRFGGYDPYKVTLVEYDLQSEPPRVRLSPSNIDKMRLAVNLAEPCVVDELYADYNSKKVLSLLAALQAHSGRARHIHQLMAGLEVEGWRPFIADDTSLIKELRTRISTSGGDPENLLNAGQWRALRGVMREPVSMVWGPPGTGKTHTVAHILVAYIIHAITTGQPVRILVAAFTHHAIANVLTKLVSLADAYGLRADHLAIVKVAGGGGSGHAADEDLPERIELIDNDGKSVRAHLGRETTCVVVGSTVWGTYKAMEDPPAELFDVVLIDEASQMLLSEALIALAAMKSSGSLILAGDDKQLPPIIHGSYPVAHEAILSSVFAFMRSRMESRLEDIPKADHELFKDRFLFQLEENFRMNEPLTAYPRQMLYDGRFFSTKPDIRMRSHLVINPESDDLLDLILHPDRAAVLCRYNTTRSYTSRNPIEAGVIGDIVGRLAATLIDDRTGELFTPVEFAARGLAVLSPHRAQNSTIRTILTEQGFGTLERPMPLVDTVDKLQGQERDIVLVSYGVADEEYARAEGEFLLSSNRFNVAATRARHKLVVLCSDLLLDIVPTDRDVLLESMMLKEYRSYCCEGNRGGEWIAADGERIGMQVQWMGFGSAL
jgi:hypothetical protein